MAKEFIREIPIWVKLVLLIYIHCESEATLSYIRISSGKSRYISIT